MTLADLSAASFVDRVRDTFTVSTAAASFPLVLIELEELGQSQHRLAFSLRFLGPAQPVLPQATYRLDNAAMGTLEIFLVPLGPGGGGMRYEAVFT
jgi:tellurite resistance protein TehA-like permease